MAKSGRVRHDPALESVWDYPLPPVAEPSRAHAQVIVNGFVIADSASLVRVLQTGAPPAYYFPFDDVRMVYLQSNGRHADDQFRGRASYYDVSVGDRCIEDGAWTFRAPLPGYEVLTDHVAFFPSRMDACLLDGEPVRLEPADDSGGWITANILGLSRGYPRFWDRSPTSE